MKVAGDGKRVGLQMRLFQLPSLVVVEFQENQSWHHDIDRDRGIIGPELRKKLCRKVVCEAPVPPFQECQNP